MTILVERVSDEELQARRAEIIDELGGDEADIRHRAAEYSLDSQQQALFRELEGIDFLHRG